MTIGGKSISEIIGNAINTANQANGKNKSKNGSVQQEYFLTEFNKLEVSLPMDIEIIKDPQSKAMIQLQDDLFEKIDVYVENKKLCIGTKSGVRNFSHIGKMTATIYTNSTLLGVDLSSACSMVFPESMTCKLESIDISGASTCIIHLIESDNIEIDISGASNITINTGTIKNATIDTSGASSLLAKNVAILDADMDVSGASKIETKVTNKLSIDASGVSNIVLYTTPKELKKDTSGLSKITIK